MSYRAQITEITEYLFRPETEALARKFFGDTVVDALPRFVRGKHKGAVKGMLTYRRVLRGGWVRTGKSAEPGERTQGYVEKRVGRIVEADIGTLEWGKESTILHHWEAA